MMTEKLPVFRVVSNVLESHGSAIQEFLDKFIKEIDPNDHGAVLRAFQNLMTSQHALVHEFRHRLGEGYQEGIIDQFQNDVKRLFIADFLKGYAKDLPHARTKLSRVECAVTEYFKEVNFHVGRSQRFAIPVFPVANWDMQLECLRSSLETHAGKISAIDEPNTVTLSLEDDFADMYAHRITKDPIRPKEEAYALCGVHGGRDTLEYAVKDILRYLTLNHRIPLTFMEALALYTAHPRFLQEQERVVLLAEKYISSNGTSGKCSLERYAFLSSPQGAHYLRVGLVSIDAVDKVFGAPSLGPHAFHAQEDYPNYGKPSASAIIAS